MKARFFEEGFGEGNLRRKWLRRYECYALYGLSGRGDFMGFFDGGFFDVFLRGGLGCDVVL